MLWQIFLVLSGVATGGDAELVDRLQRRDPQAMADLYDRYARAVYSVLLRIVRNEAVAEELAQEVFLRAWNRVGGFHSERGRLGAWLLAIARNRGLDFLRSTAGQQQATTYELVVSEQLRWFECPENDLLDQEQVRRIRQAFSSLNANQRKVLELAYFEGVSQTEMAARLGQPLGTIKSWVRTALSTLRERFHVA